MAVDVWAGSLVERRVDGNLKVVIVEAGRRVQDGQHVLQWGGDNVEELLQKRMTWLCVCACVSAC